MEEYTTGNNKVDYMSKFQLTGNITPQIWYKTITKENGKPYLLAIAILSEIVYWYRPTEIRDEATGHFLGYKKKFKLDILQRSYDQFAELFGESKRSVTDAIVCLEMLGVIKRVFRVIEVAGVKYNNVLFIDFFPEKLYKLTYPNNEDEEFEEDEVLDTPVPKKCDRGPEKTWEGSQNFGTCNTKNTKENITESILSSSSSSIHKKEYDEFEENEVLDTPVPKKCDRGPEKTWEGSQNFGTRNTKNTKENTTKNILSSSSSSIHKEEDEEFEEDDDEITREYFAVAEDIPRETVTAVIFELKKRGNKYLQTISPPLFLEICKNITEYASSIINKPAYIKKCVDNMIAGQKLSQANKAYRIRAESKFLSEGYDATSWEDFERKLLSN